MARFILILLLSTTACLGYSQNYWSYDSHDLSLKIPEVSLITVMPVNYTVNLALSLPSKAGAQPGESAESKDDKTWLNYSCSLRPNDSYRKVYAQITTGYVPPGLHLDLEVKDLTKPGKGQVGKRYASSITLTNRPQVVVNRIGGGCTNRGSSFGHQLIYQLKLDDINQLVLKEPKTYLTITYTISD